MSLSNEEVLKALNNETVEHVPVGFWRHFADNEFTDAFQNPEVIDVNLKGHADYYGELDFDLAKTMLDGYFPYPFSGVENHNDPKDLNKIEELEEDDPWISKQIDLAIQQKDLLKDLPVYITVFSPLILFKWGLINHHDGTSLLESDRRFADLYENNPDVVRKVLNTIANDQKKVIRRLKSETSVDGIYYSTQSIQDQRLDNLEFFNSTFKPVDLDVQDEINKQFEISILHICGFDGAINHLEWFADYPLQVINWATIADGYSLGEGKKLFNDRVVLGGFDNSNKGVLYSGSEAEIRSETRRLIDEAGKRGVIIGADCTIPRDIPYQHLKWVIDEAHKY